MKRPKMSASSGWFSHPSETWPDVPARGARRLRALERGKKSGSVVYRTIQRIGAVVAILVAFLTVAGGVTPQAGGSPSPTPTGSPTQTAAAQPTVVPAPSPASAYLDDRDSPEALIRSYYEIGRAHV